MGRTVKRELTGSQRWNTIQQSGRECPLHDHLEAMARKIAAGTWVILLLHKNKMRTFFHFSKPLVFFFFFLVQLKTPTFHSSTLKSGNLSRCVLAQVLATPICCHLLQNAISKISLWHGKFIISSNDKYFVYVFRPMNQNNHVNLCKVRFINETYWFL